MGKHMLLMRKYFLAIWLQLTIIMIIDYSAGYFLFLIRQLIVLSIKCLKTQTRTHYNFQITFFNQPTL